MSKSDVMGRKIKPSSVSVADGSKFYGAVFLFMFLALVITGVVATGLGALFSYFLFEEGNLQPFYITLVASLLLYIPVMIWVQVSAIRNSKGMIPAYVIYAITMGGFLATFSAFIDFQTIAIAFGGTCLAFALMALIAWFTRRNLNGFAVVAYGLLLGSLLLALINLPLTLLFGFNPFYWVISFAMLFFVIIITIIDLRNVKNIAERGGAGTNVALLCALSLYVDFIYIFIRVLALVSRLRR